MEQEGHFITVEQRKKFTAAAIDSVDAFSDRQIVLSCSGGKIVVGGSNLKITAFSKTGGTFTAAGDIDSVKYCSRGTSLGKKLFK